MYSSVDDKRIPAPWAANGSRAEIPAQTSTVGRACWSLGFPEVTAKPIASGGVPPHYADFQGVLNQITEHVCWLQDGGRYTWQASANYHKGAVVVLSGTVYQAKAVNGPSFDGAQKPGSDGGSYWAPIAGADGSTLQVASGAMSVKLNGVASGLADGKTISASGTKLGVMLANIVDGTTIVASTITSGASSGAVKLKAATQGVTSAQVNTMLAASLASYVKKSGDTMTGALTVSGGITAATGRITAKTGVNVPAGGVVVGGTSSGTYTGIHVSAGGITVSNGGVTVKAGRLTASAGATVAGGATLNGNASTKGATINNGAAINGGATIAGGATVRGGETLAGGNLVVNKTSAAAKDGNATIANALTVGGLATLNGGLKAVSACVVPTAAAGANNSSAANTLWVNSRINTLLASSGGIARPARIYAVYGSWNGDKFSAGGGSGWISGGELKYGGTLKEGRYFISGCVKYKPIYIVHNCAAGNAWCRIRAGRGLAYSKVTNPNAAGASGKTLLSSYTTNGCYGGKTNGWYKLGVNSSDSLADPAHYGAISMENMVLIPSRNGIVIFDFYDGSASTDDIIQIFN